MCADDSVSGNTAGTQPENRLYYPALDGVRGVAFLMVFGQHYLELPWGWTGVNFFFVLSGFLITGILYDSRNQAGRVRTFFIRRVLRIFPLYYGVLLFLLLLTPLLHWRWSVFWWAWPTFLGNYLRFLHPSHASPMLREAMFGRLTGGLGDTVVVYLGHFWSICVEEQFYLIWPWVVFAVRDRRRLMVCCVVAVVVVPVLRSVVAALAPAYLTQTLFVTVVTMPLEADALLLGGLIALLLRGRMAPWTERVARWCGVGTAGLLAIMVARAIFWRQASSDPLAMLTWGLTLVDLLAAVLILRSLTPGTVWFRIFSLRPLRWLGRISYGAYLFHDMPRMVCVRVAKWLGGSIPFVGLHVRSCSALLGFALTLAVATLSFRYFELPFLRLKERLAPPGTKG